MSNSNPDYRDPTTTEVYLKQQGWIPIAELDEETTNSDFYFQSFKEGLKTLDVLLEVTPSGRYVFYVEDPPEVFRAGAHDGACLSERRVPDGEDVYRLHFSTDPDSVADGARVIRELLRGER